MRRATWCWSLSAAAAWAPCTARATCFSSATSPLKVLHVGADGEGQGDGGDLAARLTQEARTLARLEHPGIVPVHDVGLLADGRPYYTMKLVHG